MNSNIFQPFLRSFGIAISVLTLSASVWPQLFSYYLIDQPVNDIAYSRTTGMIYASVPSTGGNLGNHIIVVNPNSRTIVNSVFAGSEPNKLAVTSDGKYLYVGLNGSSSVKRYPLSNMSSDISFNLGSGSNGFFIAEDIAPILNRPDVVAVSRQNTCCSPRHEGVAIYENGVQLPTVTPRTSETNEIEAGGDQTALFGYNNETSGFQYRRLSVDGTGVSIGLSQPNTFGAYSLKIRYSQGRVYASNGKIVEAYTGVPVGEFALGGFANGLAVDRQNRRALFVMGSTLRAFHSLTFQPIGVVNLPTNVHNQAQLTRWGRRGVAYRTNDGKLAIAESLLITRKTAQ
ncbi:MAG: YncE family protein [Pyrinomonadaceae bacterium]